MSQPTAAAMRYAMNIYGPASRQKPVIDAANKVDDVTGLPELIAAVSFAIEAIEECDYPFTLSELRDALRIAREGRK